MVMYLSSIGVDDFPVILGYLLELRHIALRIRAGISPMNINLAQYGMYVPSLYIIEGEMECRYP